MKNKALVTASTVAHLPWRKHTDEQLGIVPDDGGAEAKIVLKAPRRTGDDSLDQDAPEPLATEFLCDADVASICRLHFSTFQNLEEAGRHYGLTDGRLSQIQTGIDVSCPRVLSALGIKRVAKGVYQLEARGNKSEGDGVSES